MLTRAKHHSRNNTQSALLRAEKTWGRLFAIAIDAPAVCLEPKNLTSNISILVFILPKTMLQEEDVIAINQKLFKT